MSWIELTHKTQKWYGVTVHFTPAERERLNAHWLHYAGAAVRYDRAGNIAATFRLRVDIARDAANLVRLMTGFGAGGYFDEGKNFGIFFRKREETEREMTTAQQAVNQQLANWHGELSEIINLCIREKRSRGETLRLVRAALGNDFPEAEIRQLLEEQLRARYQSTIFCATILRRRGWKDPRRATNYVGDLFSAAS